jgi:hypothetical protein
MADERACRG